MCLKGGIQPLGSKDSHEACVAFSKTQKHQGLFEVINQLQGLSLEEKPDNVPLTRLQHLFSFRTSESGHFPEPEKESFRKHLAMLPDGTLEAVVGSCPFVYLLPKLKSGALVCVNF